MNISSKQPVCKDTIDAAAESAISMDEAEFLVHRYFGVTRRQIRWSRFAGMMPEFEAVAKSMNAVWDVEFGADYDYSKGIDPKYFRRLMGMCRTVCDSSIDAAAMYAVVKNCPALWTGLYGRKFIAKQELVSFKRGFSGAKSWQKYIGVTILTTRHSRMLSLSRSSTLTAASKIWNRYDSDTVAVIGEFLRAGLTIDDALIAAKHGIDIETFKASTITV